MTTALSHRKKTNAEPRDGASRSLDRYLRLVNYLAATQIYLKANPLLDVPLRPDHIKDRLLGHWGTCPGINLLYLHLNQLIRRTNAHILLITGPGHGAAANLANMYIEGTITEFFPELTLDKKGLEQFIKWFSWPTGFPSHLNPALPGVIHEGGELGYALPTAFGAALDNPDLLVACVIGDGEAETGATATAWHGTKFLNPATDGAVLPILHLNAYKIASPTIFGTMTNNELETLFQGYGYRPVFVEKLESIHEKLSDALDLAYADIQKIRAHPQTTRPRWPMIILKTPKGWTGPKSFGDKPIEGTFRSHQVPIKDAKTDPAQLKALEEWFMSYRPSELFDTNGAPADDIRSLCPSGDLRMALNKHAFGGQIRRPLKLPSLENHAVKLPARGAAMQSPMQAVGRYLKDVVQNNEKERNFRIVCPDELESNRLGAVLTATRRQYEWPLPREAEAMGADGRVLEMLSEHMCQGWLQGYLLTGRHGLFPCYEAFIHIIDGMMNQYAKFLKSSLEVRWRRPISSLNYLLTSETWRQDHNGYSHQGPGFINNLLTKKGHTYRIYLPPDINTLLSTVDHCLASTNTINLIIAGKQPMPQWLTTDEAAQHCRVGASVWRWAGTRDGDDPEVILACGGDNVTMETMAAAQILRHEAPDWRLRVVNVTDLQVLGIPQKYPHGLDDDRFHRLFPLGVSVVFNFHGYTAALKQLLWERPHNERFDLNGYREEGTTTTPFDMHVRNRTSRYHLVIQAAQKAALRDPRRGAKAEAMIVAYEAKLKHHRVYINENGRDPEEIERWKWEP